MRISLYHFHLDIKAAKLEIILYCCEFEPFELWDNAFSHLQCICVIFLMNLTPTCRLTGSLDSSEVASEAWEEFHGWVAGSILSVTRGVWRTAARSRGLQLGPNSKLKTIRNFLLRQIWGKIIKGILDFALSYSVYPRVDLNVFMPRSQEITK